MKVGDLVIRKGADDNGFGFMNLLNECVDLVTLRMTPPTAMNRTAHNLGRKGRLESFCGLKDDAVISNEIHGLTQSHLASRESALN